MAACSSDDNTSDGQYYLLRGEFSLFPRKKVLYDVRLTQRALLYSQLGKQNEAKEEKHILISDLIGCRCRQGVKDDCSSAYCTVYAYPFRKKIFTGKKTRYRLVVTFGVHTASTYEGNLKIAENWSRVIRTLSQGIKVNKEDVETCSPPVRGRMMILVNPHSGSGKALQTFHKEVLPMLLEADVQHEVIVTNYAGHAKSLAATMNLQDWYGVVIVSGDGLLYEVINGLMERTDWNKAIKMPVGVLPGGSGNALCCSINYYAGEAFTDNFVLHSTFVLVKHRVLPMDLVSIQTRKEQIYSFLSTNMGFIADVDFESEKYRNLGGARFTVGVIKRIMGLRTYRMKLSFLPIAEYHPKQASNGVEKKSSRLVKTLRRLSLVSKTSSQQTINGFSDADANSEEDTLAKLRSHSFPDSSHMNGAEDDSSNDEDGFKGRTRSLGGIRPSQSEMAEETVFSELLAANHEGKCDSLEQNYKPEKEEVTEEAAEAINIIDDDNVDDAFGTTGAEGGTNNVSLSHVDTVRSDEDGIIRETFTVVKKANAPAPTPLLSPLGKPVPDNWVTIEDEFILISAVYQSHLSYDCMAAPVGRLSDGFIHLLLLRKDGVTRNILLNLLMTMEEGGHVDSPHMEIIKALAFRIEPLTDDGIVMVDGERVDFGPIQGQILPSISRIMGIR